MSKRKKPGPSPQAKRRGEGGSVRSTETGEGNPRAPLAGERPAHPLGDAKCHRNSCLTLFVYVTCCVGIDIPGQHAHRKAFRTSISIGSGAAPEATRAGTISLRDCATTKRNRYLQVAPVMQKIIRHTRQGKITGTPQRISPVRRLQPIVLRVTSDSVASGALAYPCCRLLLSPRPVKINPVFQWPVFQWKVLIQ
jgi:hypothetical protein